MTTPLYNSIREGEVGGVPTPASAPAHNEPRSHPGMPGSVTIGKKGSILSVELPPETVKNVVHGAAAVAMQACKAAFEHWKEAHPEATKTPIRYTMCSKEGHEAPQPPQHKASEPQASQKTSTPHR